MLCRFSSHLWQFEGSVSTLCPFLDFSRSSAAIRVIPAPVSRRASQTSLAGSTILLPMILMRPLIGPMTSPNAVQVSVVVQAIHPSGHTSV